MDLCTGRKDYHGPVHGKDSCSPIHMGRKDVYGSMQRPSFAAKGSKEASPSTFNWIEHQWQVRRFHGIRVLPNLLHPFPPSVSINGNTINDIVNLWGRKSHWDKQGNTRSFHHHHGSLCGDVFCDS